MCKCNAKNCGCLQCKQCSCSKSCNSCSQQAKKQSSAQHHIGYSTTQEQEQKIASSDVIKRSRKGD